MSNYFSQFVPHFGNDKDKLKPLHIDESSGTTPQLKYISVFNPSLVGEKEESSEEFLKQVLCFTNGKDNIEDQDSRIEQLKLIGLIRGVDSFARNFTKSRARTNIIKSSKSSIILHNLEPDFYLACSISNTSGLVNQQLIKLIETAHQYFVMFHLRCSSIIETYGLEVLQSTLFEYWTGFLESFNSQLYKIPPGFTWTHMLNYKGFLGLLPFPSHDLFKRTYKRSSISLSQTTKDEIDLIFKASPQLHRPQGLIISYFNKTTPKKYGMIHMNNVHDGGSGTISRDSLIDIHNWLEYYDYHAKLDTENLTKISSSLIFESQLAQPEVDLDTEAPLSEEGDPSSLKLVTVSALELLNPVTLTNNLVVLPLNYTVNSMINIGEQVTTTIRGVGDHIAGDEENQEPVEAQTESTWLSMPPLLKSLRLGENQLQHDNPAVSQGGTEDEDYEEEDYGEFLTGAKQDINGGTSVIHRKLVYLPTEIRDRNGDLREEQREYLLVIFTKLDILITLIYESSNAQLDNVEFFENLSKELLSPAIEEISNLITGGSIIGNSLGSLKSLNGILKSPANEIDSEFFFVVYDGQEGSIQTSLPYLPNITIPTLKLSLTDRAIVKYQGAMFFLHEQLSSVFLMSQNKDFFNSNEMNEYFHKFTSNKTTDWMFYYIKHKGKYIIIIKNHNRHSKSAKRASIAATNIRKASVVAENGTGSSVFHKITDGAYDYAQLGFLDNLGVDVKYWLESFSHSGET
ncbi:uncharacterized protein CANTADRAFT_89886 [Suhomyces tanzawaensis NRRL Y-17324]|uniref:CCZ1/INTU/HSP4 first Longin domain-containing protein n=1 Tax=Suhomyces tanzawaensis NRRL Y-17324 TaxID=984487 RepID=A0A1E4SLC5_9ASCO|nr:uncharacterized protein CANTADRAFT_89886 [Suhomyces tanzawaensis NRRL Y-17324]ODV80325.1 hypothetical protein CANTADRAFT_89886 [Suhomyces tanzawaensis NRRL Y-17324]